VAVRHREAEVEIEIADRGPGIPDEFKQAIFEKFASVESATGNARRGFGLGLHLVKLVAAAHGGQAAVSDREGGGTVFRLFLPERRAIGPKLRTTPEVGVAGH
jgi:signal transduction histidine kinase